MVTIPHSDRITENVGFLEVSIFQIFCHFLPIFTTMAPRGRLVDVYRLWKIKTHQISTSFSLLLPGTSTISHHPSDPPFFFILPDVLGLKLLPNPHVLHEGSHHPSDPPFFTKARTANRNLQNKHKHTDAQVRIGFRPHKA